MMFGTLLLAAEGIERTVFQFGRIESNADWIPPITVGVVVLLLVRAIYALDTREVSRLWAWGLLALRTAALLGLLVYYLQPQWRTQRELVQNSRVLMLVDTSSSMGLRDVDSEGIPQRQSRSEQVADALATSGLLGQLQQKHDVVLFRFDENLDEVAALRKRSQISSQADDTAPDAGRPEPDWPAALSPAGAETRLGEALDRLISRQRNLPISGIVVFSDGGQNAGSMPAGAIRRARRAKLPIHTIGLGSARLAANVRVYKLEAAARVFPGDPITVSGLIQTQGQADHLAGKSIAVELLQRPGGQDASGNRRNSGTLAERKQVVLGPPGQMVPVQFELTPDEAGPRILCLRIDPPAEDLNTDDDYFETEVDVVNRKDRVLLLAGGPTREYRFLRTQLYRDRSTTLDVLLQSSRPGISQEADRLLDDFPATRREMFDYDCVVAFDPDWKALSAAQIDLLETWVAEQGGGLIVVAGPVYTGEPVGGWSQDPAMEKIRALYPIEFRRQITFWDTGTYVAKEPWPVEFTREGLQAEFLWLDDTAASNQRAWAAFRGVFAHQPVRGVKPAATVYARFSDPRSAQGGQLPVFFAGQFYGSGQVFYIGSGELWRLRRTDEAYFERFYTRLIRHVSAGRLLRQSSRGVLMLSQDRYTLGSAVEIRARLTDARLAPLAAEAVPLEVFLPDGNVRTVQLRSDLSRAGTFAGQLAVLQEGTYRLELTVPESDDQRLTRRLQVVLPDLERENPQRNEPLLAEIAGSTGGRYFDRLEAAVDSASPDGLAGLLKDRTRTTILDAAPQPLFDRARLTWLMCVLCGLLLVEWFIRRLIKLA